jgi:type II secretory pathway component GspD/PulD (secretin)
VEVAVNASVTSHVGYTPHQSVPIISESSVDSIVLLEAGKPAVIGGLSRTTTVRTRTGIPGLKDVPLIKYLVSREVERRDTSQIVITIELEKMVPGAPIIVPTEEALPAAPSAMVEKASIPEDIGA